ncbi:MAG: hypothetical protein R3304_13700 [Longimicrobiales bacterium]|nr:hypothetical protein [Longimicrobiales bacterium]
MQPTHDVGPEAPGLQLSADELRAQYLAYRRRQSRALLGLLPEGAIRPLYRRALEGGGTSATDHDPMERLLAYCEALLPLPPFDVWRADREASPRAHWSDVEDSADVPSPSRPATLELRSFRRGPRRWTARLRGFRDQDVWRGFIAFQGNEADGAVHRTAVIFREATAAELRDRFNGFESASLEAFLRSALP